MQKGYPGLYLQAPVPDTAVPGKSNGGRNAFLRQDPVTERWGDTVPKTIYKPLKSNIYDKVQFFYST